MTGQVVFEDGVRGEIWPELLATEDEASQTRVRLENGGQLMVPTYLLVPQADGTYRVSLHAADIGKTPEDGLSTERIAPVTDETVVPVIAETVQVRKRIMETGKVTVTTATTERTEVVDEALMRTTAEISRVPIGRIVDTLPEPHQEGDTLVIPVVEEVLVVEKRLMLVEEVHITQRQSEYHAPQAVTLRRQEVSVQRTDAE